MHLAKIKTNKEKELFLKLAEQFECVGMQVGELNMYTCSILTVPFSGDNGTFKLTRDGGIERKIRFYPFKSSSILTEWSANPEAWFLKDAWIAALTVPPQEF